MCKHILTERYHIKLTECFNLCFLLWSLPRLLYRLRRSTANIIQENNMAVTGKLRKISFTRFKKRFLSDINLAFGKSIRYLRCPLTNAKNFNFHSKDILDTLGCEFPSELRQLCKVLHTAHALTFQLILISSVLTIAGDVSHKLGQTV